VYMSGDHKSAHGRLPVARESDPQPTPVIPKVVASRKGCDRPGSIALRGRPVPTSFNPARTGSPSPRAGQRRRVVAPRPPRPPANRPPPHQSIAPGPAP
jgi:hypothetical protein